MPEYNSLNENLKKQYEETLLHVVCLDKKTVYAVWRAINLFENFTGKKDFITFSKEQAKGFKRWLAKQVNKKGEPLSLSTQRSTLHAIREFFKWLAMHPAFRNKINAQAIIYLQLSQNEQRASRSSRKKPIPTIEEINITLNAMSTDTDIEKRNRAMMAFTALTGVRDAALISLKMKDVNLLTRTVWQDPNHVKTKYRKGIETFFMPFDPLWAEIVSDWVCHAKEKLNFKDDDPLFPKALIKNNPNNLCFENFGLSREHWANATPARNIFRLAFESAGLPYYNPHSFRDMLSRWAMDHCNQKEYKAVSQNVGHENVDPTYNSYGKLSPYEQRKAIVGIGKGNPDLKSLPTEDLVAELNRRVKS
jgi:integrase